MKSMSSKAVMAATLVMVVSLTIVLVLVLVLLAELYCSLLLRRRHSRRSLSLPTTSIPTVAATAAAAHNRLASQSATPLNSFYSQGVLQPPQNFLLPSLFSQCNTQIQTKSKTHVPSKFQQDLDEPSSPEAIREISIQPIVNNAEDPKPTNSVCGREDDFVCISNPIYSNEGISKSATPFQTPDSSPSRLDIEIEIRSSPSSSSEEKIKTDGAADSPAAGTLTPPLTPMKELPQKACSVSLRDATSLETSGSDSNSNNGGSSSSSGSPRTSPSW